MQIQLVDYLENYLTNRLTRTKEVDKEWKMLDADVESAFMEGTVGKKEPVTDQGANMEEDVEMLKRLIREVETGKENRENGQDEDQSQTESENHITDIGETDSEKEIAASEEAEKDPEELEIELLEEFVQSFLA